MGRSATATLIYGVRFAKRELMKPDDDEQWSHEVLETFGDIDEFYSTTVEEGLAERFDLKLKPFDENEEQMYALYSGDRTDAECGCTEVGNLKPGDGKFSEALEALGLNDVEPTWLLIAQYG